MKKDFKKLTHYTSPQLPSPAAVRDYLRNSPDGRFNLVLGSVISAPYPSYFPDVPCTKRQLLNELVLHVPDDSPTGLANRCREALNSAPASPRLEKMPYELLWEQVARAYNSDAVVSILTSLSTRGSPNGNHKAIAWLIEQGYVFGVITTNFDEYIEHALSSDIEYAFDASNPTLVRVNPKHQVSVAFPRFIKLHGTISAPESLAFMFPHVTSGFTPRVTDEITQLLTSRPTLFCGYGCNDWDLRSLWPSSIKSVWVSHKDPSDIDPSLRWIRVAKSHLPHGGGRIIVSNLKYPTGGANVNILEKLVAALNGPRTPLGSGEPPSCQFTAGWSHTTCLAVLARLLDSLALEQSAELYAAASGTATDRSVQSDLLVAGSVAQSHGGNLALGRQRCEDTLRMPDLSPGHRLLLEAQLFFLCLMTHSVFGMCYHGWQCRRLFRSHQEKVDIVLAKDWAKRNLEDHALVEGYAKAAEIIAHNFNRYAFLLPPLAGVLQRFARRALEEGTEYAKATATMWALAGRQRESAHTYMLAGDYASAQQMARISIEAYQWAGYWQWAANAYRTEGWIHLQQRTKEADRCAKRSFECALDLAETYGSTTAEMVLDKIKALLELHRVAAFLGEKFERMEELTKSIAAYEQKSADACRRFRRLAAKPPRHRRPLG